MVPEALGSCQRQHVVLCYLHSLEVFAAGLSSYDGELDLRGSQGRQGGVGIADQQLDLESGVLPFEPGKVGGKDVGAGDRGTSYLEGSFFPLLEFSNRLDGLSTFSKGGDGVRYQGLASGRQECPAPCAVK